MIAQPQLQGIYNGENTRRSCIFSKQELRTRRRKAFKGGLVLALVLTLILALILIFGDSVKTPATSSESQQLSMSAAIDRAAASSTLTASIQTSTAASLQVAAPEDAVRVS